MLRGAGDTHLAVALERLARKFGVNVDTAEVAVPYRETITVDRPRPRARSRSRAAATASTPSSTCASPRPSEGAVRSSSTRSSAGRSRATSSRPCRRASRRRWRRAGVFGFPVVDVRVECYDGKYHSVDSSDMAFRTAAAHRAEGSARQGRRRWCSSRSRWSPSTCPRRCQGDVLGDLNSRRGRVSGHVPLGDGHHEIAAIVPAAEIQRYAVDLRSMTGGRGRFDAVHDHYDVLPSHLTSKLLAEKSKAS